MLLGRCLVRWVVAERVVVGMLGFGLDEWLAEVAVVFFSSQVSGSRVNEKRMTHGRNFAIILRICEK